MVGDELVEVVEGGIRRDVEVKEGEIEVKESRGMVG